MQLAEPVDEPRSNHCHAGSFKENHMRNTRVLSLSSVSIALLALGACHNQRGPRHEQGEGDGDRDGRTEEHHEPELGAGISTHRAVGAITRARCEREERCGNVGDGKSHSSMDVCEDKIRADWSDDLNKYECPQGIVQAELDECLKDIRGEDCSSPFDTLTRVVQCNSADICDD